MTTTTPETGARERWLLGNVHLESLDSAPVRAEQLAIAGQILSTEEEEGVTPCSVGTSILMRTGTTIHGRASRSR